MITAQTIITVVILYLVIINVVGYVIMGVDKKRAIRGAWRISEASLFFTALLGGSLGCILGMQHFRHKTKHWYFKYGMPAILVVQVLLFALFIQIGSMLYFFYKMSGSKPPTLMPTDCSVLRTPTILPNIRISWDYHPTFMLISGAGPKVFHPPMSKLMWA